MEHVGAVEQAVKVVVVSADDTQLPSELSRKLIDAVPPPAGNVKDAFCPEVAVTVGFRGLPSTNTSYVVELPSVIVALTVISYTSSAALPPVPISLHT